MVQHTIKVVVIGASGVGKTSLRSQYITSRFSTGYRATIGADFISKTITVPGAEQDQVVLQIWDTAGQERFSSLSTAFFRGADAVVMVYDVNRPETLHELTRWWAVFKEGADWSEEAGRRRGRAVVVGNKVDLLGQGEGRVEERDGEEFVKELLGLPAHERAESGSGWSHRAQASSGSSGKAPTPPLEITPTITPQMRSPSASMRFGTVTTTHTTTLTIYHTPSSSFDDSDSVYSAYTAREASLLTRSNSPSSILASSSRIRSSSSSPLRNVSPSSLFPKRTPSLATITPEVYHRAHHAKKDKDRHTPHFLASAKSGVGVAEVFEYLAAHAHEASEEDRQLGYAEAGRESFIDVGTTLRVSGARRKRHGGGRGAACC
ncbi:P-loop containing nucleoside triphosphate hydrolase protein [Hymenopellis radicata]|nr:P-loop containing nucleoside triphosphate hydrolase protein [Hymenopellis radicata]